jgi:hypothetical protein
LIQEHRAHKKVIDDQEAPALLGTKEEIKQKV